MPTTPRPGTSLADAYPVIASEWLAGRNGELTPTDVTFSSNRDVWWRCGFCGREWVARVQSRTRSPSAGCGRCKGAARARASALPVGGRSLADVHPNLAAEWHPTKNGDLKPSDLKPKSNRRVWWRCAEGHEWAGSPNGRGENCPECANVRRSIAKSTPKPGRSLGDRFPEIAGEWHPTRNGSLTPFDVYAGSKTSVWWSCSRCGFQWQAHPYHRTRTGRLPSRCQHRREQYRSFS